MPPTPAVRVASRNGVAHRRRCRLGSPLRVLSYARRCAAASFGGTSGRAVAAGSRAATRTGHARGTTQQALPYTGRDLNVARWTTRTDPSALLLALRVQERDERRDLLRLQL